MNVVCNTTPLIALASVNQLELLRELYGTIIAPQAVLDEVGQGGLIHVPDLTTQQWVQIVPNIATFENQLLFELDYGERHVILYALKFQANLVLIDDRTARNIAEYYGLVVKGTLGVLVEARRKGLIQAFRPLAEAMRAQGIRFSERLIQEIALALGE